MMNSIWTGKRVRQGERKNEYMHWVNIVLGELALTLVVGLTTGFFKRL